MWIRQKWLPWTLAQFFFHITENSHEVSSMVEMAKFSFSFYNRSSADAPWVTLIHEFTELNKNLRRMKVSLVWCLGKDWAHTVTAGARSHVELPAGNLHEGEHGWAHPTIPAREQAGWGGSQSIPQPHCQMSLWWHTGSGAQLESLQVRVWVNRVHNQAGMRQGWGQGHLQLGWGQTEGPRLSWNGVHFNAFHSAKSSS